MAATETAYRVRSLHEEIRETGNGKAFVRLDSALDMRAFGVGAASRVSSS